MFLFKRFNKDALNKAEKLWNKITYNTNMNPKGPNPEWWKILLRKFFILITIGFTVFLIKYFLFWYFEIISFSDLLSKLLKIFKEINLSIISIIFCIFTGLILLLYLILNNDEHFMFMGGLDSENITKFIKENPSNFMDTKPSLMNTDDSNNTNSNNPSNSSNSVVGRPNSVVGPTPTFNEPLDPHLTNSNSYYQQVEKILRNIKGYTNIKPLSDLESIESKRLRQKVQDRMLVENHERGKVLANLHDSRNLGPLFNPMKAQSFKVKGEIARLHFLNERYPATKNLYIENTSVLNDFIRANLPNIILGDKKFGVYEGFVVDAKQKSYLAFDPTWVLHKVNNPSLTHETAQPLGRNLANLLEHHGRINCERRHDGYDYMRSINGFEAPIMDTDPIQLTDVQLQFVKLVHHQFLNACEKRNLNIGPGIIKNNGMIRDALRRLK